MADHDISTGPGIDITPTDDGGNVSHSVNTGNSNNINKEASKEAASSDTLINPKPEELLTKKGFEEFPETSVQSNQSDKKVEIDISEKSNSVRATNSAKKGTDNNAVASIGDAERQINSLIDQSMKGDFYSAEKGYIELRKSYNKI